MVFSLVGQGLSQSGENPFANILSDTLKKRQQMMQQQYYPRQQEADIFAKKIGPMAQIAISPMFSLLPEEQQKQFAHIMQRSMAEQEPHSKARGLLSGLHDKVSQMFGGKGSDESNEQTQQGGQGNNQTSQVGHGGMLPGNPGEHYTAKFGETGYTPNKVHLDANGNPIAAPDEAVVKRARELTLLSKNLDKDWDKYMDVAPKFAQSGALGHKISEYAGEGEKSSVPFVSAIGKALGGGKVAEQGAEVKGLRAKLAPVMHATGFTPQQIADNLDYQNGESGEHYKQRLKELLPYLKDRIHAQLQASISGTNVGGQSQQAEMGGQQQDENEPPYGEERQAPPSARTSVTFPDGSVSWILPGTEKAFLAKHPDVRIGD